MSILKCCTQGISALASWLKEKQKVLASSLIKPALFFGNSFEMLASDRYGLFVAIVDERIVGFAIASLHQANAGHIECWLDDLGVKREWQANGIGAALTEQMLAWGRQGNARYFLAEASVNKAAAPGRLLEHYGFQPLAVVYWRER